MKIFCKLIFDLIIDYLFLLLIIHWRMNLCSEHTIYCTRDEHANHYRYGIKNIQILTLNFNTVIINFFKLTFESSLNLAAAAINSGLAFLQCPHPEKKINNKKHKMSIIIWFDIQSTYIMVTFGRKKKWPYKMDDFLKKVQFIWYFLWQNKKNVTT